MEDPRIRKFAQFLIRSAVGLEKGEKMLADKQEIKEAKEEGYVRITRVGSILSETSGVLDYTNLKINQGTANIPIAVEEYPGMGDIELVVSE